MNPGDPTSAEHFRRRTGILFLILILWGILAAFHILYYSWYRRDRLLRESMHLAWREGVLPQMFKEHAGLKNGMDVIVAGVEIGVELWSAERWEEEQRRIGEHMRRKSEQEMEQDLL